MPEVITRYRILLGAALAGVLLLGCHSQTSAPPSTHVFPTAYILTHPNHATRVIPATPTPTEIPPPSPTMIASPSSTVIPEPSPRETPTSPAPTITAEAIAKDVAQDPAMAEAALIAAINRVRVANNLSPYKMSTDLSAAARAHSCDLAAHRMISHLSSDGKTLADRLAGSAERWKWPSESVAAGLPDAESVVAAWMDEPPDGWHRRNILDANQEIVGAGYCFASNDPSGNHHYWTADFARHG